MPNDFQADSIGMLLTDVTRLLRSAFERRVNASPLAVTPGEARALIHVSIGPASKQAEIAARMGIEPMTLSACLDRLEAQGLVSRTPASDDRRAKNVVTTSAGKAQLAELKGEVEPLMETVLAGLPEEAREALRGNLAVLKENLMGLDRCGAARPGKGEATQ